MLFTIIITVVGTLFAIFASVAVAMWFDAKSQTQKDIDRLLARCREAQNWDDRSEMKLNQWLLGADEDALYKCGLIKLRRIHRSISDYHYLHVYGRDPVPPPGVIESALQNWSDRLRERRNNRVRQPR